MAREQELTGGFRVDPQTIRSLRLFAEAPGAPRSRRPTDAVLLAFGAIGLLLASWVADPPGSISNDITQIVADTPEWLLTVWVFLFDVMVVWAGLVLVLALIRKHVTSFLAVIGAIVAAVAYAYLAHRLALGAPENFGDYVKQFTDSEGPAGFPGVRLVMASAVLITMSPAVSRPFRFFGRLVLLLGFLASVGLGVATFAGAVGGLAAGAAGAATVHLIIGSPGGRPSLDAIRLTLDELGVPVQRLEPATLEPAGVVLLDAVHEDGRPLSVKVYGADAWDGQFINKLWRWMWYRDGRTTLLLSRFHQVEHEALMTMQTERAGAPVPHVLVAGQVTGGDAAMVATAGATPLRTMIGEGDDAGGVADATVVELWDATELVHDHGIVHGALDLDHVTVDDAGHPLIVDWAEASVAAAQGTIDRERAQLVALAAIVLGTERSVEIAREKIDGDDFQAMIPYLQRPALNVGLRRAVKEHDLDVDELRDHASSAAGIDDVELIELRRVTVKSVLSMLLVAVAAALLISSIAEIGFDTIVDELSNATWSWVVVALLMAQIARFWNGVGTTGATNHPLRLGPTVVLEFAITFVNLVIPSSAGRFATKMRYFQKAGMTLTSATAMGAIDSLAGFTVQITILAAAILFGVGGIEFDIDIDAEVAQRLAIIVVIAAVVLIVAAILAIRFIPAVRDKVMGPIRQIRDALRVVRSPSRLLRLFGGNAMAELTFASVLGLSLLAYGESAPLMSLLVVNVGVALLAGLMPVPGGVGVSEAALTAGLVAIGVDEPVAFATAITSRLCTFYLPPIWGYVAMRWLRENDYL